MRRRGRHEGTALAAALGLLMLIPVSVAPSLLVDEANEDADLDLAAVFAGAAGVLVWLLVGITAAVALFRDGREGRPFWAWCAVLALAALMASAVSFAGSFGAASAATRVGSVIWGTWTATAGIVAALFLPWRRVAARRPRSPASP